MRSEAVTVLPRPAQALRRNENRGSDVGHAAAKPGRYLTRARSCKQDRPPQHQNIASKVVQFDPCRDTRIDGLQRSAAHLPAHLYDTDAGIDPGKRGCGIKAPTFLLRHSCSGRAGYGPCASRRLFPAGKWRLVKVMPCLQ